MHHRHQRMSLRSRKKHRQQRMPLRSLPLQKRTLKKASITNPKCSPVSATTTAMGTRWVMPNNLSTAQEVLFSNDPAHVQSAFKRSSQLCWSRDGCDHGADPWLTLIL